MPDAVQVVAFDLMDTLVRDPYREALTAAIDGDLSELFRRRDADAYPAFERGEITESAYWATFVDAGFRVDPEAFHAVRRAGYAWMPGMRSVLEHLRAHEVRVVVASNYPHWVEEFADGMLAGLVDAVHASCHLGVRKPDPAFYERLAHAVGSAPDRILFVDDREVNVDAARGVGLHAVLHTGPEPVLAALRSVGLEVPAPGGA